MNQPAALPERIPVVTNTPVDKRCPACDHPLRRLTTEPYPGLPPWQCPHGPCRRTWFHSEVIQRRHFDRAAGSWPPAARVVLDAMIDLERN